MAKLAPALLSHALQRKAKWPLLMAKLTLDLSHLLYGVLLASHLPYGGDLFGEVVEVELQTPGEGQAGSRPQGEADIFRQLCIQNTYNRSATAMCTCACLFVCVWMFARV